MPLRPRGRRLIRGIGRTAVVAGTAGVVSGRVHHHQHEKWQREDQEEYDQQLAAQEQYPPPAPGQAPAPQDDMIDKIQQLSSLHESGVLTDEEFVAAKAKLLG
jgi:hypothetical protein